MLLSQRKRRQYANKCLESTMHTIDSSIYYTQSCWQIRSCTKSIELNKLQQIQWLRQFAFTYVFSYVRTSHNVCAYKSDSKIEWNKHLAFSSFFLSFSLSFSLHRSSEQFSFFAQNLSHSFRLHHSIFVCLNWLNAVKKNNRQQHHSVCDNGKKQKKKRRERRRKLTVNHFKSFAADRTYRTYHTLAYGIPHMRRHTNFQK